MFVETSRMCWCCKAIELGCFGGGEAWDTYEAPYDELLADISKAIRSCKRMGDAVIYATTMSNQKNAAKVLSDLGFYTSKPFKVIANGDDKRKMQAWFLPVCEYKGK